MNTLILKSKGYKYEIDGKPYPTPSVQTDYFVDGNSMGLAFQFEDARPWFGSTCFETIKDQQTELILQLRGLKAAENQFKTDRFVLYRCHCGDDNCGIISCQIERDNRTVRWIDVRYEDDFDASDEPIYDGVIPEFVFDVNHYDSTIQQYAEHGT